MGLFLRTHFTALQSSLLVPIRTRKINVPPIHSIPPPTGPDPAVLEMRAYLEGYAEGSVLSAAVSV